MPSTPPRDKEKSAAAQSGPPPLPQKRSELPDAGWAEKRTSPRAEVTTEVSFESETNFYVGFTADISTGGLFVVTWNTVPIGTQIVLNFTVPSSNREIKVNGTVRWVREHNPNDPDLWPGMGIQFHDLDGRQIEAIEGFVKEREPLFYE